MRKTSQLALGSTIALALSAALSLSAFAESRHQDGTVVVVAADRDGIATRYRDNDRVTHEGRITRIDRDRDGYRVTIDRNSYGFWVPERALRGRSNDFRVGVSVRLAGVFRGGRVNVDLVEWPAYGYGNDRGNGNDRYDRDRRADDRLRGRIERVDYRRDTLVLRDDQSGRLVSVDMDRADRSRRGVDLDDLRRGDRVELLGDWNRNGSFRAVRIENVRKDRR